MRFIGMMRYLCCRLHNDWQVVEDERFLLSVSSVCLLQYIYSFYAEVSVAANLSFFEMEKYDGTEYGPI